jgi:hypothetical protein
VAEKNIAIKEIFIQLGHRHELSKFRETIAHFFNEFVRLVELALVFECVSEGKLRPNDCTLLTFADTEDIDSVFEKGTKMAKRYVSLVANIKATQSKYTSWDSN